MAQQNRVMSFLRRLNVQSLLFVLAMATPLVGVIAYLLYTQAAEREREAADLVRAVARDIAEDSRRFLARTEALGDYLRSRPGVRAADPSRCGPQLAEVQHMNSIYVNILLVDTRGQVVCWSLPQAGASVSYADRKWFRDGMDGKFGWGIPVLGRASGEWVVTLTGPVRDDQGGTTGLLTFGTSLAELTRLVARPKLPAGSVITIVDREGTILVRSLEPEKWLGKNGRKMGEVGASGVRPEGAVTMRGVDGVLRIYAAATVPGVDWRVSAGIPSDAVLSHSRERMNESLVATGLAILVALAVAGLAARRILTPIRSLAAAARAASRGELEARAVEAGPLELGEMAAQFNQMLAAWAHAEATLAGRTAELTTAKYARSLIEASLDPLVTISAEGKITDVNKATEDATGVSRERLIGTDFSDYFTEPEKAREGYRRVLAEGLVRDYPLAIRHAAGSVMDVLYNAVTYRNKAGDVQGVFAAARDVTETRKTQEQLARLAAIVESSDDAIVGKTLEGTIVSWNRGAERIYGYTAAEAVGKPVAMLLLPGHSDEVPEILSRIRQGEHIEHYETVRMRKDGRRIDVSLVISPIKDADGNIVGASTITRDITEAKRAEEALREAARYSRSLIEASLDPLVTISPEGKITDVNRATEESTGVSRERLIGADFDDYFTEPDKARAGYEQVLREGYVRDYPLTLRHASGGTMDVLYNATVYRNQAGELQGVFAAARDVTEFKRTEEQLRAVSLYARSLIEASLDPLVTIGPDGRITDVNAATEGVTGCARAELIGTDFSDYFTEPEKARAGYRQVFREGSVRDYPLEIRHLDGRITPVLYNAAIYRDAAGRDVGVFAAARDITERKRAEEQLRRFNEELEQRVSERTAQLETSNRELEAFSYSVSHDLRTPLRAIDGFSQTLLEDYFDKLDPQGRDYLERVRAATQRMAQLIDDLIDLSRATRAEMRDEEVDLSAIARAIGENLRRSQPARQVIFRIQEGIRVRADRRLMERVLENLIGNAWKFTGKHPEAIIEFGQTRVGGRSAYFVRDDGAGFDMAYANKLFGAFQRLHAPKEFPGTGIGLALAQRVVRRHGGELWAEGGVEKGATFYFTLGSVTASEQAA